MARGGARPGSGSKAKPREQKEREGTLRRDRDGPDVRPADGRRPPTPAGLTASMKTAWKTLLDDLESSALLDSADAPLYEAFAVAFGRAREARRLVTKHGMLISSSSGTLVANPMLRVERDSLQQLRMLSHQLAIGMAARASLGMAVARGTKGAATRPDAGEGASPPATDDLGPSPRLVGIAGGKQ